MKKNIFLFICLLVSANCINGQNLEKEVSDSLFSALSNSKEDTGRVSTLLSLTRFFRYKDQDTAFYFANHALALATKLNFIMGVANSKLSLGGLMAEMGRFDEGAKSAEDALEICQQLSQSTSGSEKIMLLRKIGRSYGIIGHNKISQGNYPEGLKNSLLAIKIFEELGDQEGIGNYKWNIANIYITQHDYSNALKYYSACLEINNQSGNKKGIADSYSAIGFVYFEQGNYKEALKYYSFALKLAEEVKDVLTLAEIYINLGAINEELGNYDDALKYDFAALKNYLEVGFDSQIPWVYTQIGSTYSKLKRFTDASEYFELGLSAAKKVSNKEYIKLGYEKWALLDSSQGNYKKALEHFKLAIIYRDSLLNEGNTKKLVQQQMQYDFDKKESAAKADQEKKDAIAQKEIQKQKLVRNSFIGGFAIVLFFAGVFFSQRNKIKLGKQRSDELLLNILPSEVAEELKAKGSADAKQFDDVTVMFTDFKNFTQISEKLSPTELVNEIHTCFKAFDNIIEKNNIEKIKTIGDSYMCAGGLPVTNKTNAFDVVSAALEIQNFMQQHSTKRISEGKEEFQIRIGVHTGPVVAGIVGVKKFAYDIWGDTVNIASRMESSGEAGKVNISGSTYELVKEKFICEHRGKITAKNKGEIDMYFVSPSNSEG